MALPQRSGPIHYFGPGGSGVARPAAASPDGAIRAGGPGSVAPAVTHAPVQPAFSPFAQPGSHGAVTGDGPVRAGGPQSPAPYTPPTTPPPGAPNPNGGSGGGPGGSIADLFQGWLNSDPLYQQALASINSNAGADRAGFQQAMNQLLIQYGLTPDFEKAAGAMGLGPDALAGIESMMDPNTRAAAELNNKMGTSVLGRINFANQNAEDALRGNLASRGMLDSGDAAYRNGLISHSYNTNIYDALSRALGSFSNGQGKLSSELENLFGSGGSMDKAVGDAWTRFVHAVQSGAVQLPKGVDLGNPTTVPNPGAGA